MQRSFAMSDREALQAQALANRLGMDVITRAERHIDEHPDIDSELEDFEVPERVGDLIALAPHDPAAIPIIVELLQSREGQIRYIAMTTLAQNYLNFPGNPPIAHVIQFSVGDQEPEVRQAALDVVSQMLSARRSALVEDVVPILAAAYLSPYETDRDVAILAMEGLNPVIHRPFPWSLVKRILQDEPNAANRVRMLTICETWLRKADWPYSQDIIATLTLEATRILFKDPEPRPRIAAAKFLAAGIRDDPTIAVWLRQAIGSDEDQKVRSRISQLLDLAEAKRQAQP